MKTLTVFTPTYNREKTLTRAFDSLMKQTSKDFEWLIIDDGSTDNTEELVESFVKQADFEIRYYKKENGGRHTAVNFSYPLLRTEYVVTCDSDDELVPDAVEKMLATWRSIPKEDYDRFWCVSGREVSSLTGKIVGTPYPDGINKLKGRKQRKRILKCDGEKHCCRKVAIHIQYPFPEYPDVKFVPENTVWEVINRKYDQYCVNDVYGVYHEESPDALTRRGTHGGKYYKSHYYANVFYVNTLFDEWFFNKNVRLSVLDVSRCAMLSGVGYKTVMKAIDAWYKRFLVTLGYPISKLWLMAHKSRYESEKTAAE